MDSLLFTWIKFSLECGKHPVAQGEEISRWTSREKKKGLIWSPLGECSPSLHLSENMLLPRWWLSSRAVYRSDCASACIVHASMRIIHCIRKCVYIRSGCSCIARLRIMTNAFTLISTLTRAVQRSGEYLVQLLLRKDFWGEWLNFFAHRFGYLISLLHPKMMRTNIFLWCSVEFVTHPLPLARTSSLPNPYSEEFETWKDGIVVAKAAVDCVVKERRSRLQCEVFKVYDVEMRLNIAQFAYNKGMSKAVRKLESTLGHTISISTIQSICNVCKRELKPLPSPNAVVKCPRTEWGCLILLRKNFDDINDVLVYESKFRRL